MEKNEWTLCQPLKTRIGCLAGAALNGKIYALGGGNGSLCFSDVEMLDLDIGYWIPARSMKQQVIVIVVAFSLMMSESLH